MKSFKGNFDSYAEDGMTTLQPGELVVFVSGMWSDRAIEGVFTVLEEFNWKEEHDAYWEKWRALEDAGDYSLDGSGGELLHILEQRGLISTTIYRQVAGNSY